MAAVGLALAGVFLVLILKQCGMTAPAYVLVLAVGVLILLEVLPLVVEAVAVFRRVADGAGLNRLYLGVLLKVLAVSYLAEFAAGLCRDAGESALAVKVELAAKVAIMVISVPIIADILENIVRLLP